MDIATQTPPREAEAMTHRIGRFYTGQPSWRTRLRALRRRLGNASLPPSEEEQLIKIRRQILAKSRAAGKAQEPIRALRTTYRLPRVLLAADGTTTFRYVKALKNASTSILKMLLELTGEAAWRSGEIRIFPKVRDSKGEGLDLRLRCDLYKKSEVAIVGVNGGSRRLHSYMRALPFTPEPYADIRFCVVRDPVDRLLSYAVPNQMHILQSLRTGQDVSSLEGSAMDEWLDTIAAFYDRADSNQLPQDTRAAPLLNHHLFRQTWFLGKDASWYTHIFSLSDLASAHKLLSELAGKPLSGFHVNSFRKWQETYAARGLAVVRPHLTPAQRLKIETIYAEDYRVFGRWF